MAKKRNAGQLSSLLRSSVGGEGEGAEEGKLSSTNGHALAEDPYLVWLIRTLGFNTKLQSCIFNRSRL